MAREASDWAESRRRLLARGLTAKKFTNGRFGNNKKRGAWIVLESKKAAE